MITKSSKLTTHNTASKNIERKASSRAINSTTQKTAMENSNKAPPPYKINRPNFFTYKCPSPGISPNTSAKRDFYSCFEPPSFLMCLPICLQFVVR